MAVDGAAIGQQRRGRLPRMRDAVPLLAPLVLAAALAGAAVVTVERTGGCDTPGRYVTTPAGIEYVDGCLPLDLPVSPQAPGHPVRPGDDVDARKG